MFKIPSPQRIRSLVVFDVSIGAAGATVDRRSNLPQRSLKGDRLIPINGEPACIDAAWPNMTATVVRDRSRESRPAKCGSSPSTAAWPAIPSASFAN